MKKALTLLTLAIIVLALILPLAWAKNEEQTIVNTITIDGVIDPAMAVYTQRAIDEAERNGAEALIILMDTPGGLLESTRTINKNILASRVPIVVYIYPQGARAASAGAIITLASHVAVMSPSTNIGAAHPVGGQGEDMGKYMSEKAENDTAAYTRTLAEKRGRNVEWAEQVVRKSVSATEKEAKEKNVIEIIAKDQRDLLKQLDGRKVETAAGEVTIRSANAEIEPIPLTLREEFLHVIDNPNIAFILMMIAIYGIIAELNNPGSIFPGVIGGIALIIALFSFAVLPVNLTGILLVVFGLALLVTDLFVPSHGILSVGGIISFGAGSLILFETQSPVFKLSAALVITMTVLTAAFFLFALKVGIQAQKNRVVTGAEGLVGQTGEARTKIDPKGKVFADGTWWNAETEGETIKKGEKVIIVGVEKLTLKVTKKEEQQSIS